MYKLEEITIAQAFKKAVFKNPNGIALEFDKKTVTWQEFDSFTDSFALFFCKAGIKKGAHIAIWSFPCLEFFYAYIGLVKAGAVVIPINTFYKQKELEEALKKADVEYLLYGIDSEEIAQSLDKSSLKDFVRSICINDICTDDTNSCKPPFKCEDTNPHDVANILFTSGTTSVLKGVMLTHYNIVNNGAILAEKQRITNKDKICVSVPMFHCFGITAALMVSLARGCTLCILRDYSVLNILNAIHSSKCTVINGVPTMFLAMLYKLDKNKFDLSSLRTGIIAGSVVLPNDYKAISERLNINLLISYGLTETSPCVSISCYDDEPAQKQDSVGFVTEHVTVRIADIRTGETLDKNKPGEIQVSGYNVMKGYYRLEDTNEAIMLPDGYIKTGDIGYFDDKGRLFISGRMKEIIIRGGENISPLEIENCIMECENISQVKVVGVKADVLQEEIVACVITKDGNLADEQAIKDYVCKKLAYYKTPKYVLTFKEFPLNNTGKIKLNELKKITSNLVSSL